MASRLQRIRQLPQVMRTLNVSICRHYGGRTTQPRCSSCGCHLQFCAKLTVKACVPQGIGQITGQFWTSFRRGSLHPNRVDEFVGANQIFVLKLFQIRKQVIRSASPELCEHFPVCNATLKSLNRGPITDLFPLPLLWMSSSSRLRRTPTTLKPIACAASFTCDSTTSGSQKIVSSGP